MAATAAVARAPQILTEAALRAMNAPVREATTAALRLAVDAADARVIKAADELVESYL